MFVPGRSRATKDRRALELNRGDVLEIGPGGQRVNVPIGVFAAGQNGTIGPEGERGTSEDFIVVGSSTVQGVGWAFSC